jgi:hypothetical protein
MGSRHQGGHYGMFGTHSGVISLKIIGQIADFCASFIGGHDCFGRGVLPQGSNAEAAPESILQNATGCEDAKPSRRRMRDLENERNCVQMQSGVLWVPS